MSLFSFDRHPASKSNHLDIERLEDRTVPAVGVNEAFVASAYHTLLRRDADADGLHYWTTIADTQDTGAVVQGIQDSPEHQELEIRDLYTSVLGRQGSESEVHYWMDQKHSGRRQDDIVAEFYGSGEFRALTSNTTTSMLDRIYQNELGRGLDDNGQQYWSSLLASGMSAHDVALGILHSDEALHHDVGDAYTQLLGRAADDGGTNFWVEVERQGRGRDDVVRGLIGSDEARSKLQQAVDTPPPGVNSDDANEVARSVEDQFHLGDDRDTRDRQGKSSSDNSGSSSSSTSGTSGIDDRTTSSTTVIENQTPSSTTGIDDHSGSGHR